MSITNRFTLARRVAVVTGAGRGLGEAAARALAEAGASVVMLGRDESRLNMAAKSIEEEFGGATFPLGADITDGNSVKAAAKTVFGRFGRIDILVNNAGIVSADSILGTSEETWNRVIDTNLTGAFRVVQAFAPAMVEAGWGRIINIGSVMSGRAAANRGAYCASKAGLLNFTRALAIELGPRGVTVNTICPSVIVTDLNREQIEEKAVDVYRKFLERVPIGRWGQPDDLAGAVIFLASDAASYISGQALYIDGGLTAG